MKGNGRGSGRQSQETAARETAALHSPSSTAGPRAWRGTAGGSPRLAIGETVIHPCLSLLTHLMKVQGVCQQNDSLVRGVVLAVVEAGETAI